MNVEFRQAILPIELRSLLAFDRKVFRPSDRFSPSYWRECESWWLIVGRTKAGCCAFQKDVEFADDIREDGENPPFGGSLYIGSTGILPRFQGRGLGTLMKAWQIAYAKDNNYRRIVTNTRARNTAMIELNRKFGFKEVRITPGYYVDPDDATLVMEFVLPDSLQNREIKVVRRHE